MATVLGDNSVHGWMHHIMPTPWAWGSNLNRGEMDKLVDHCRLFPLLALTCRYLRSVVQAFDDGAGFRMLGNAVFNPNSTSLFRLRENSPKDHDLLKTVLGLSSTRIIFVRDPVTRTLSGWNEIYGDNGRHQSRKVGWDGPAEFKRWVAHEFANEYTDVCDATAVERSQSGMLQHWYGNLSSYGFHTVAWPRSELGKKPLHLAFG